jgi:hypothetical protein
MDLDGDGYISMYELEYFYEEQLQRMESLGIETLPFEDCLCQVSGCCHAIRRKVINYLTAVFSSSVVASGGLTLIDAGYDPSRSGRQDIAERHEAMSDGAHLFRHFLQPGKILGSRTA